MRAWGPPDARSANLIDGLENLACVPAQVIGLLLRRPSASSRAAAPAAFIPHPFRKTIDLTDPISTNPYQDPAIFRKLPPQRLVRLLPPFPAQPVPTRPLPATLPAALSD